MDRFRLHSVLFGLFFFTTVQQVFSVTVTCHFDDNDIETYCPVKVDALVFADVTMVTADSNDVRCEKDLDYGFASSFDDSEAYVWVTHGCGGTFEVKADSNSVIDSSSWGEWSACSVSCGTGTQHRSMSDVSGGFDQMLDSRECNKQSCPSSSKSGSWNAWGAWGACSKQCGGGTTKRIRTCSTGVNTDCSSNIFSNMQSKSCNTQVCKPGSGSGSVTPNEGFCGKARSRGASFRIIGGVEAKTCEYPWMVMVINKHLGASCGGSIIDSTHILTAAHCVIADSSDSGVETAAPAEDFEVLTGSSKMEEFSQSDYITRKVSKIKIHEKFNYDNNDVAIMTLTQPIKFDNCHVPICLPSAQQTAVGVSGCKVMGWGLTSNREDGQGSSNLLHTDIKVREPSFCNQHVGERISDIKICAGGYGKGSCGGDSGGPLVCPGSDNRYYQFGIVSSGEDRACGTLPGLYTKVTAFVSWIKTHTQ